MNDLLTKAMDTISRHSCVTFVRVRNATRCCRHTSYMRVTAERPGCHSPVGREYAGGPTVVNLDPEKCFRKVGHILHELLHALGRNHVMTRTDRGEYVDILWENINEGKSFHRRLWVRNRVAISPVSITRT
uniref:Metalloendopeptidase n=1 Tax=Timema tahoe TaxID=61484 RepID=A0A7R9IKB7_9NEOP|nr:unnamed protein product [Timema tahoe]